MRTSLSKIGLILFMAMIITTFLFACSKSVSITISFESNGGSSVSQITTKGGSVIAIPPNPTKEGYVFGGWHWDNQTFSDLFTAQSLLDSPVTGDFTGYAKWNELIQVNFDSKGGVTVNPQIVQKGSTIAIPVVSRDFYTLEGWYTSINQGVTFDERWSFTNSVVNNEITLYAKWIINQYTIVFDTADGTTINPITQDYDTNINVSNPTKTGYTFMGWSPKLPDKMPAEIMTLTAQWQINDYTITILSDDGSPVESITQDYATIVETPNTPERLGYTFYGWYTNAQLTTPYTFSTMPAENITLYEKWSINQYTITFDTEGGSTINPITQDYDTNIDVSNPTKTGYTFMGWNPELPDRMAAQNETLIAIWVLGGLSNFVNIGELGTTYLIPTGINDDATASIEGGYLMATTQTSYELWYNVRVWAEEHGYHFQRLGREGNDGVYGEPPTANKQRPVTTITWRDVIVWTNALSEMAGLNPVYRTASGDIIKDSRTANASVVDAAVQTNNNGYRLPTSNEWEMAARWRHSSGDGSILLGGRYWTPGSYASGATADYNNEAETRAVAWYSGAGGGTRPGGQLLPNHLGIYDMSGNVWEFTYTLSGSSRIVRGGNFFLSASTVQVGHLHTYNPSFADLSYGFRVVRGE